MYHSVLENVQFRSVLLNYQLYMHMFFASKLLMTRCKWIVTEGLPALLK